MSRLLWNVWMYLQFHSLKEPSKNHIIWVWVLFGSLWDRVWFGSGSCTFLLSGSGWVQFLAKPGFWFGLFLLGSGSFPSLRIEISWLDKVTNEKILRRINGERQIPNSGWQRKHLWNVMFWGTTGFCVKLLKAEWEVNQQQVGEEFKCYMIWQMMTAMLHSNRRLRKEKDGDTETEDVKNLLYSRRLLMMMLVRPGPLLGL